MTKFRLTLVALLALAACTSDRDARLRAIAEVEAHCGLPPNTLDRTFVDDRFSVNPEMSESSKERTKSTISLGSTVVDRRIVQQRECILNYHSKDGFRFLFWAVH